MRADDPDVGWYTVAELHFDYVADNQLFGANIALFTVANGQCELRHHVLERLHDLGTLSLLVVGEDTSYDHDSGENDA